MEEQRQEKFGNPFPFTQDQIRAYSRFTGPEKFMQVADMFNSPIRLGIANWTVGSLPLTTLWYVDLPDVLRQNPTFHKALFGIYAFFKPTFEFIFQVNSTKFHQGELKAWYDPGNQYPVETAFPSPSVWDPDTAQAPGGGFIRKRVSRSSVSMQPNVALDAGYSNPAHLRIPFEHPMNCLTTNSTDPVDLIGRVRLTVFNQLQVKTGGSTSIAVQIWLKLVNIEPRYPMWPHEPIVPTFRMPEEDAQMQSTTEDALEPEPASNSKSGPNKPSFWGGLGGTVGNIGGGIWNFITGNWAGLTRNVAGAVVGIASIVGSFLDKPANPVATCKNMIYPISPLAHMKGVDTSVRLAAEPMGGYTDVERFRTGDGSEMKLTQMAKIKAWVRTFTWSSSQAEGTVLYRIPVLPGFIDYSNVTYRGKTVVSVDHTYLSWVASMFQYWRGGLSYRFDFKGTQFQTGRVTVSYIPNVDASAGAQTYAQTTCCDTKQFDIHETREFTYDVPYFSSTPWKMWFDWPTLSTTLLDDRFTLGYLEVRVATPLAIMEGVVDSIDVNIYVGASDDIQFAFPLRSDKWRCFARGLPLSSELPEEDAVMQMLPGRNEDIGSHDPAAAGTGLVQPISMLNENITDVRDLGRRYAYAGRLELAKANVSVSEGSTGWLPVHPGYSFNPPPATVNGIGVDDPQELGSQLFPLTVPQTFAFVSGGLRFKFLAVKKYTIPREGAATTSAPQGTLRVFYKPWNGYEPEVNVTDIRSTSTLPSVMTHLDQQRALEVEIPYSSCFNQLFQAKRGPEPSNAADAPLGYLGFQWLPYISGVTEDDSHRLEVEVFISFAEDTTFSFLTSPPPEWIAT